MARNTFFSFHYERDAWRAGQVRNCDLLATEDEHGFIDAVEWEKIEREGDASIKRWIQSQLEGTTVTVVLIGAETAEREWVRYEILESWNRGNGVVGVRIHNVKDMNSETDSYGANPFDHFKLPDGSLLSAVCKVYDWVIDDGRTSLGSWSEEAIEIRKELGLHKNITEIVRKGATASAGVLQAVGASRAFTPRAPWCPDHGKH